MRQFQLPVLFGLLGLASCHAAPPAYMPGAASAQPVTLPPGNAAPARISGPIGRPPAPPPPSVSYGSAPTPTPHAAGTSAPATGKGDISFDFADTDIRAVVAQILGNILHVNYTIDPSVSGTVTLHTVTPLTTAQVLPTLQTLLAQNGDMLVRTNGLYRVMPTGTGASAAAESRVIPLRYANAQQLATVLQPYISKGGALTADPASNSIVIQGDPATRAALAGLVQAFDVDALAGQSYELFPVTSGDATDFANAFTAALGKQANEKGAGPVTVVPLERIGAVLVIARTQSYLSNAARIYAVINQVQRETVRSWHVFYLRNSQAEDDAYLLQQAFTPDNVTATPTPAANQSNGASTNSGTSAANGFGNGSTTGTASTGTDTISGTPAGSGLADPATGSGGNGNGNSTAANTGSASALLGPLTANTSGSTRDEMRIIPDPQNNAVMVYATAEEADQVAAMLSKVDIQPLQVRIDATIAEVDLTGQLQYGTQFFFKSGGINAVLSQGTSAALDTSFPGFVLSGHGSDAAPLALSALEAVTKVRVLSSPELMVLNGQSASLKVGDSVPYLAQTSQSTVTSTSDIIQSIDYRDTGVIMKVTPHIGNDGLVTMDISQEVSGVASTTSSGIDSPTFTERTVNSRVAVQDGQTIGLAGLISDNDSQDNSGLPWLKNLPVFGGLFGTQNNNRTREELLVLITPHVMRNQQQALDLTEDMKEQLPNAAAVPEALQKEPFPGSADPDQAVRARFSQ